MRFPLLVVLAATSASASSHQDLVALFDAWRAFQKPPHTAGVPDYGAKAMAAQAKALPSWLKRLDALDTKAWSQRDLNDVAVVRAEMNGLDFDHRVLRPWALDPSFYVTVFADQSDQPLREGPWAVGGIELWQLTFPLSTEAAATLVTQLKSVPPLLSQARANLVGTGKDLWNFAPSVIAEQVAALTELKTKVKGQPELEAAVTAALDSTTSYGQWVLAQAATKTGPSGVGKANYNWYLAHVQLVPFSWDAQVTLMERELARAKAALALEELKNAKLPPLLPATTVAEHQKRFDSALSTYLEFLKKNDFITWEGWMKDALAVMPGPFKPEPPLEFFSEVEARDPMLLRLHLWHFMDLAVLNKRPPASPIRRVPALYNIFNTRTEGVATALEELMMHAGLFEGRPRSRELVYVMAAQRAARALGDLKMHAREWTLEQAAEFACANTPRGWLRPQGRTVRAEQHLYLRQPGYGTSYVIGKLQLDALMAAQPPGPYPMKKLLDGLNASGLLPMSLLERELKL